MPSVPESGTTFKANTQSQGGKPVAWRRDCWQEELLILLLKCPQMARQDQAAYATIFGLRTKDVYHKMTSYRRLLEGEVSKYANIAFCKHPSKKKPLKTCTPILRELLAYGFRPFSSNPTIEHCDLKQSKAEVQLDPSTGLTSAPHPQPTPIPNDPNHRFGTPGSEGTGIHVGQRCRNLKMSDNLLSMDVVNHVSRNLDGGKIKVPIVHPPFATKEHRNFTVSILGDFKSGPAVALIGLALSPNEDSKDAIHGPRVVHGRVLFETHRSPTFRPQKYIDNIMHVLRGNLGMCAMDVYNRQDVRYKSKVERQAELNEREKIKFLRQDTDTLKAKCKQYRDTYQALHCKTNRIPIINLADTQVEARKVEAHVQHGLLLDLNENLDLSSINSIAVLMGKDVSSLQIKEILTEDFIQKCKAEVVHGKSWANAKNPELKYLDKHCSRMFWYIIMFFSGLKREDIYDQSDLVKENVSICVTAFKKNTLVKYAEENNYTYTERMCTHCGLLESKFTQNYYKHVEVCALEHQRCDCEIDFKTPQEKHLHMKLVHSGKKYFKCPQCNYAAAREESLTRHIKFHHESAGGEVQCDLCLKVFKNENNVRVHRLAHEVYYCKLCDHEILGRNPYKNHMMNIHGDALECNVCNKRFHGAKELFAHEKQAHSDAWKRS